MANADLEQELLAARILIVDDEPANVRLLEKMLAQQGYLNLRTTTDPREGVEIYRAQPQDLVVLDMRMPYMDGVQVMTAIQAIEPDNYPPVLVLTAQADTPTRMRALEAGARDFLGKPFERTEVLLRIRNQLEVRLLQNRLRAQNSSLEDAVRSRTVELIDTRLQVIRRLGRAAEYRDNETGLHIIRMSQISAALARARGLDKSECELILDASPMHDIGKIGIPDAILLKPGKLTPEEWETMKTHPGIGAEILSGHDSELMRTAADIALGHHEKWDGSGYPNGAAGTEIPLAARIVAVADVFDALTSVRPYKKAWTIADSVAEIDRLAGCHLDPELVDLFHKILPEAVRIKDTYAEPTGNSHLHMLAGQHATA